MAVERYTVRVVLDGSSASSGPSSAALGENASARGAASNLKQQQKPSVSQDKNTKVSPSTAGRSYDVHVGPGVRQYLAEVIPADAQRAAVITQANIGWAVECDTSIPRSVFNVPDGEQAKSLTQVESLCRRMVAEGFTRSDVIVAVGGGVVTDLAGFVAAVYHRGIRFVSVPTTLLAQVDAAIGGKTGVNLPEGKNLVGAFWQPHAVLCDTDMLETLPERELRSGQGEMAKYHFLGGDDLHTMSLTQRIAAAVQIKADVVASDERESDRRVVLNYGHTLGHAIETAAHYDLRHGEAVAIGLIYAAEVAFRLGRISRKRVEEHREVVASYNLPMKLPAEHAKHGDNELLALMRRDKKATKGLTFVLDSSEGVTPVMGVPESILRDALAAIR
ncbi:MAG: 3-dehydroquinate synthase [Acidimicrobiaceae bacterium]|nr:3-dehydroquinate synthase [Acidimicrobiaceae bacterium]